MIFSREPVKIAASFAPRALTLFRSEPFSITLWLVVIMEYWSCFGTNRRIFIVERCHHRRPFNRRADSCASRDIGVARTLLPFDVFWYLQRLEVEGNAILASFAVVTTGEVMVPYIGDLSGDYERARKGTN